MARHLPLLVVFVPLLVATSCPASSPPVAVRSPVSADARPPAPRAPTSDVIAPSTGAPAKAPARERAWSAPVDLDPRDGYATFPVVAMDASGNAIVAWHHEADRNTVHVRRFDSASARWDATHTFASPKRHSQSPRVAMTRAGAAVLVWTEYDRKTAALQAARYAPKTGWEERVALAPWHAGFVSSANVAMDERGDIIAVWELERGAKSSVHSNRFDHAAGAWTGHEPREQNRFSNRYPSVAFGEQGDAMVAWVHYGKSVVIHHARFDATARAWQATPVQLADALEAYDPVVTMGPRGAAWITWTSYRGTKDWVFVSAWDPDAARWELPVQLSGGLEGERAGHVVRDDGGGLVAVWGQPAKREYHVGWRTFDGASRAWSKPAQIHAKSVRGGDPIGIARDDAGNVLVAWMRRHDGRVDLLVSRLDRSSGVWSMPELMDAEESAEPKWANIAASGDGTAVVVWTELKEKGARLFARRFE